MSSTAPIYYSKGDYIETESGNKVSRKHHISGSSAIVLSGKTIIHPGVTIRGDLRRVGGTGQTVSMGKYCVLHEGAVVRPPSRVYKGTFTPYPLLISAYVHIGSGSVVLAASIGTGVVIGKNCVIGKFAVLKDYCEILDGSVVPEGQVVGSLTVWEGSPARPRGTLPDSTPELVEQRAKAYYARFQPE